MANSGDFGNVCLGSFADEELTLNNSGVCPLSIISLTSSAGDFITPSVAFFPLVVGPGDSIDLPIRFQPAAFAGSAAILTIVSNDPTSPTTLVVSGTCPAPQLNLIVADTGNFGKVCVGCFVDRPLTLTNSGKCTLTVTAIASSDADFIVPEVLSFPITIGPGDALAVPIRFEPLSFGVKSATITVTSDDPASPASIQVFGDTPSGTLAVSGSTTFGGVNARCCADRTISICNVGDCALHVTSVHFKRKSRHWRLLHNPFAAKLHPGSCLPLTIQYRATEKCARCCELIIESDDPVTPVKTLEVLAYTVWEPCCKEEHSHHESCCRQGYPCCCEDDEDESDLDQ
ncbi:MAG TPA: choice-of-anchor D domain-containing protein [Candidatus Acidoferrales bacterium]|nr:choice-of-anchor D domain-containing protein [Candidatus Acidoferrales bacterium]